MSNFIWDLQDLPKFVIDELDQRTKGYIGMEYKASDDIKFRAQKTTFFRLCSNSKVGNREGFILNGISNSGYDDTYGLNKINATILGYDCGNKPHYIPDEKFKHKPCPGVTSISTELSGGEGKFRITTVKWLCWSKEQLEYMTPYFLTPGVSISVEFGWTNFNHTEMLPINDAAKLGVYFKNDNSDNNIMALIKKSNGNYDASMGLISDFDFNIRGDGSYDCSTVIKNVGGYFSGVYSAGRTSPKTADPTSGTENLKTFISKGFNELPNIAKDRHENKSSGNPIAKEIFYGRSAIAPKSKRNFKEGLQKNYDFDMDRDTWYITLGYLIRILNSKCGIVSEKQEIFTLNIDNSVISAHPNLISSDGRVLLIPNPTLPQLLAKTSKNESDSLSNEPGMEEANAILKNQKSGFDGGSGVYVTRVNANSILNWWRDSSELEGSAFPAQKEDKTIKRKFYYGYLKNLYVSNHLVKDAVENNNTYKDIILYILNKINSAAGNIWEFEITPLSPDGNNNGKMTIVDHSSTNNFNPENIYDFKLNRIDSIIKDVKFSVKSTDAVTVQTLFSKNKESMTQDIHDSYIWKPVSDRLIKEINEMRPPEPEQKSTTHKAQDRIPSKENPNFFFYTRQGTTYSLAEPISAIQMDLLNTKKDNPLRYSSVQPNTTLDLTISGISGIVNLNCFTVSELPRPYGNNCYFQVSNVKHDVTQGNWNTSITANIRLKPSSIGKM